jgi:hypothetical protein
VVVDGPDGFGEVLRALADPAQADLGD